MDDRKKQDKQESDYRKNFDFLQDTFDPVDQRNQDHKKNRNQEQKFIFFVVRIKVNKFDIANQASVNQKRNEKENQNKVVLDIHQQLHVKI